MQKWLYDNDLRIYNDLFYCNRHLMKVGQQLLRVHKNFDGKYLQKMTVNDSKSYLNKLVDEYNNTYHRSIGRKV